MPVAYQRNLVDARGFCGIIRRMKAQRLRGRPLVEKEARLMAVRFNLTPTLYRRLIKYAVKFHGGNLSEAMRCAVEKAA